MRRARGKEIAENVIRPGKEIPVSCVNPRCAQLLIMIDRLWKVLKRMEGGWWARE